MASVKKKKEKVTKTIEVEEDVYHLTLSKEEAEVLFSLVSRVNSVNQSHNADIWVALERTGIKPTWNLVTEHNGKRVETIRMERV